MQADPDSDGVTNFEEWAYNGNPKIPSRDILPEVHLNSSNQLTIDFRRQQSSANYIVQASPNLTDWSDLVTNPGSNRTDVSYIERSQRDNPLPTSGRKALRNCAVKKS